MDPKNFSTPLSLGSIQVTDAFWKKEMELVRTEVIPYQWEALNDRVPNAEPSFCMKNFKLAGTLNARKKANPDYIQPVWPINNFNLVPEDMEQMEERFYGFVFQDSDFAKWIEAVGYSLAQHPDPELEKVADEAIDIVCAAQQENGYLDTFYIINDTSKIFTNLKDYHEFYCFGHLTEGAVAYFEATGKDKLLKAACRYADFIDSRFGPEEGKCKGYPGHEIAEMALVRLYHATGNERYLALSRFFIEERGTKPYYFDSEPSHPYKEKKGDAPLRYHYYQSHLPVREQKEAVGHAVRAVYLYSGMADIARLTKDESLLRACETLWDNIASKKLYITGGIGGTHIGEAFSFNYDLPNDTAYAETCASIGLVFFARRMLQMKADSRYADVMERALFNGVLSGMALDGKSFFYVNPLEVLPEACRKDERKRHVAPVRQKWFGCACCPPNIARLVSSISSYAFTENEDTLFVHLYVGCELQKQVAGQAVSVKINSGLPYDGHVTLEVKTASPVSMTLALRLPEWADTYTLSGAENAQAKTQDGYLYLTQAWEGDSVLSLDFPIVPKLIVANPAVREDAGKAAVVCGPMVYCLEEADNGKDLHLLEIDCSEPGFEIHPDAILGAPSITALGYRQASGAPDGEDAPLYRVYQTPAREACRLTFLPYYMWDNRGEGEMAVWVRRAAK